MQPTVIQWSLAPRSLERTVLTDRDGVLGSVHLNRPDEPEVSTYMGVVAALETLAAHDVAVVVISNQGAVGRGEHSLDRVLAADERLRIMLDPARALIDYVALCPHSAEQRCWCRKPRTASIEAVEQFAGHRLCRGWFIGDRVTDMEAAKRLGVPGILVETGHGRKSRAQIEGSADGEGVRYVADFAAAVATVVEEL